jgi:hypothetical protein
MTDEELEPRIRNLEEQSIKHECIINEQVAQGAQILKRLDEQDANDVTIKDELIKKIDENRSKFNDALWAIAMLLIGGLLGIAGYALILR